MKDDVFAQTAEIKTNVVKVLNTLDEVHKTISLHDDLHEEAQKLADVIQTLDRLKWNLDEIEHLVIAGTIGADTYV